MPRPVRTEPSATRLALKLRRDRGENAFDPGVGLLRPTDHDRRAMPRTFLAAGHTHANERQTAALKPGKAPHRVAEIRIAGVNDNVVLRHQRAKRRDLFVNSLTGLHHDNHRARRTDRGDKLFHRVTRNNAFGEFSGRGHEGVGLFQRAVKDSNPVAFFRNVERQIRPHHPKTDQTNFRLLHIPRLF